MEPPSGVGYHGEDWPSEGSLRQKYQPPDARTIQIAITVDKRTRHHFERRLEHIEGMRRSFFVHVGAELAGLREEWDVIEGMTLVSFRNSASSMSESESEEEWYAVPVSGLTSTSRAESSVPSLEEERRGIVRLELFRKEWEGWGTRV